MEIKAGVMRTSSRFANSVVSSIDESVLNNQYRIEVWPVCQDSTACTGRLNRMRRRDCHN